MGGMKEEKQSMDGRRNGKNKGMERKVNGAAGAPVPSQEQASQLKQIWSNT